MKLKYIATIAIATILGLVTTNLSSANSQAATNSNSTTISSNIKLANACAGKENPCAGKNNATTTPHPRFYTENGVALDGQDVVSYFTQSKLVMGKDKKHSRSLFNDEYIKSYLKNKRQNNLQPQINS